MMPKRKERLEKGIVSILKQIEIHKRKLEDIKRAGNIGLAEYYEKELESLKTAAEGKHSMLKRK